MPEPQWSSKQKVSVTKPIKREPLLTADDVAQLLNVKPTTVYEWARMDYIPHIRLGVGKKKPCLRFRLSAIATWLDQRENAGRTSRLP